MAQGDDKIKALYNGVSKDYDIGTFDEFSKKLANPTKRKAFYDGVGKEYNLGNYEEFEQKLGKPNEVSTQGSKNTSQTSTEPSVISQSNPFGQVKQTAPTIDVPTGKVGNVKVQTGSSKPKSNFIQDIGNATIAGLGQLGNIASSIPSGIIDTYGRMNIANATPVGALGILDDWIKDIKINNDDNLATQYLSTILNTVKGSSKDLSKTLTPTMDAQQLSDEVGAKGIPQEYNPFNPNNEVVKYFREVQKSNHDKANANYKGGILEAIKNGEYSTAGKLATLGAVESLPLTLGMIASRGAGLSGNQLLTALGVGTTETEYQQLKENNPNIDKNVLLLNAQLTGLGEAGSELLGTNLLYDQAKNLFRKGAKDEAEKLLKTGLKSFLDNMFKKSFVGASALSESIGEMVNQVWKNAIDKWTDVDPQRDYTDGVIDAGIVSLLSSSGIATGAKVLSKVVNPKVKQELKEQTIQINDLSTDVDNSLLPEQTREDLLKQTIKTTERINNKIDKELETFNQLTEQDQKKVISINDKIDVIDEALSAEQITPTTKATLEEQKIKLKEQLSEIKPPKKETKEDIPSQVESVSDINARIVEIENDLENKILFEESRSKLNDEKKILQDKLSKIKPVEEVKVTEEVITPKETDNSSKEKYELKGNELISKDGKKLRIAIFDGVNGEIVDINDRINKDKLSISVIDENSTGNPSVAGLSFFKDSDGKYYSNNTFVNKEFRRKGIASSMYDFAKSQGLDIKPSDERTTQGTGFTNKYFNVNNSPTITTESEKNKLLQGTKEVKPKYTIKGEQVTPKIEEETTNAVQKQNKLIVNEVVRDSAEDLKTLRKNITAVDVESFLRKIEKEGKIIIEC